VFLYQFPLLLPLAAPGFLDLRRRDRELSVGFLAIGLLTAAFAATHGILESYVFYLPCFALISLCIGLGSDALPGNGGRMRCLALAAAIALQVLLYRATPVVLERLAPTLIYARDLPNRPANQFFLWPPKRGYTGARAFAEDALQWMPHDAVIMADWTPFAPLRYLQDVEGFRPDVLLVASDAAGLQALREHAGKRPAFLANNDPRYYPLSEIEEWFVVEPVGHVYQLHPLEPAS
jgi:hypothetical protein